MDWDIVGQISQHKLKSQIIELLAIQYHTPTKLQKKTGHKISNVSAALASLVSMGLVKCLTPKIRKGKLYTLTEKGKEVFKGIEGLKDPPLTQVNPELFRK